MSQHEKTHYFNASICFFHKSILTIGNRKYYSSYVDTKDFYLYSALKTEHIGKGIKNIDDYYFSTTAATQILPLSIKNLQSTFASNTKFRYLVESDFATDRALTAYDDAVKEYKIKYLYEQSASL